MGLILRRFPLIGCIVLLLLGNFSAGQARGGEPLVIQTDWSLTGAMVTARQYHTLSVLPDGRALAVGGKGSGGVYLNSSEIYTSYTNTWAATGDSLTTHRSQHTATVLLDGRVLAAGGLNGTGTTNTAEIYNPATGQWDAAGTMNQSRVGHTATRLADGRVLVVGGCYTGTIPGCVRTAEIYDPAANSWSMAASLPAGARKNHTATLLQDGSVLVSGGILTVGLVNTVPSTYKTAYRYFPATDTWSAVSNMVAATHGRSDHSAVLRRDGKVLVVGGYYSYWILTQRYEYYLDSVDVYDPASNTWSDLAKPIEYARMGMAAVLDAEGNYILLGGELNGAVSDVEYLDVNNAADDWHFLFGELVVQRRFHAAAVLPGGVILVAGGRDQDGVVVSSAETNRFWMGSPDPDDLRPANYGLYRPSLTLMPNGDVLVTGGGYKNAADQLICHNYVHRWVYADDTFTDVPAQQNMLNDRCGHSVTLLPDGRVVVIGGYSSVGGGTSGPGEIFDGSSWSYLSAGGQTFKDNQTVLLPNGKLLILQAGGLDAYIFDPVDLSFRPTLNQPAGTYSAFTATLMRNGKVLVLGGLTNSVVEVFDPLTETFTTVPHPSPSALFHTHEAVLLPDGYVMVTGGRTTSVMTKRESFLFNPVTQTWSAGPLMAVGRRYHTMLVLPDGRPVVIGGLNTTANGAVASLEIYDRADNAWHAAGTMLVERQEHASVLTLTGKILNVGGLDRFGDPLFNVERFNFENISTSNYLWKPVVTSANCVDCAVTKSVRVTGSGFSAAWEGSSSFTNQSAANQPLVQIMRLDNGQMQWLAPGEASSNTSFRSAALGDFPDGPVIAFVYVNGSFQGKVAQLSGFNFKVYLPMLRR